MSNIQDVFNASILKHCENISSYKIIRSLKNNCLLYFIYVLFCTLSHNYLFTYFTCLSSQGLEHQTQIRPLTQLISTTLYTYYPYYSNKHCCARNLPMYVSKTVEKVCLGQVLPTLCSPNFSKTWNHLH